MVKNQCCSYLKKGTYMFNRYVKDVIITAIILFLMSCGNSMEKTAEKTKAIESIYNDDIKKAHTSEGLTKADISWHAVNTYGWDCEEVILKDEMTSDGFFCIECSSGVRLRVYPRQGQHPKITNITGGYN